MRCGIFTSKSGKVLIIHDQNLDTELQWAEFDCHSKQFSLVHEDGKIQHLGLNVCAEAEKNLLSSKEISLAVIKNQKVQSLQNVILILHKD